MLILRIAYIIAREHIFRLIHKVNCVTRWWFVVRCEESALEQLQEEWQAVALQTAWKLEPLELQ